MRTSRWIALVVGGLAGVAAWIGASPVFNRMQADLAVSVLASLYRWTAFYWLQNRLGALIPLLATPIQDPVLNLVAQQSVSVFCGLLACGLLAWLVTDAEAGLTLGVFSAALIVGLQRLAFQRSYLPPQQPYAASLCLGALGLLLISAAEGERPGAARRAGGWACLLLALWVNVAAFFFFVPVVLLLPGGRKRRRAEMLLALGAAWAASLALAGASQYRSQAPILAPCLEWPRGWLTLLWNALKLNSPAWTAAGVGLAAFGWRSRRREDAAAALPLLAGGFGTLALMGCLRHTAQNRYEPRYAIPLMLALGVSAAIAALLPLLRAWPPRRRSQAGLASLGLLLAATAWTYGAPSLAGVGRSLDPRGEARPRELLEARCTHALGDYWDVWPAVLAANASLYRAGEARIVWGISPRAEATRDLWMTPSFRKSARLALLHQADPRREPRTLASLIRRFDLPSLYLVRLRSSFAELAPARPEADLRPDRYLAGDWNGDGRDDLAWRDGKRIAEDLDLDSAADVRLEFGGGDRETRYLTGDWAGGGRDALAFQRGACVHFDENGDGTVDRRQCYAPAFEELLAGDWDGDGKATFAFRRGDCVELDLDGNGSMDRKSCPAKPFDPRPDPVLAGDWNGDGKDTLALLRGDCVELDLDGDGSVDRKSCPCKSIAPGFDQIMAGDWDGDGKDELAVRRGALLFVDGSPDKPLSLLR